MNPYLGRPEPVLSLTNPDHLECLRTPQRRLADFLSFPFPLEWDRRQLEWMKEVMERRYLFFESVEESRHKKEVLAVLSEVVKTWSFQVALKEKQPEGVAAKI